MTIIKKSIVLIFICLTLGASLYADKASIRGDGTLLVNGKAVFPIGIRTEKAYDLKPIADAGFNMVMGSGEWELGHYKEAQKNKLLVLAGHYVWANFRGTQPAINLRARGDAIVRNLLENAKDQRKRKLAEALKKFDHLPGVIGWKTGDEPEAKLTEIVEAGYEIIKSYNPNHIVGPITCDSQWVGYFRNACDVLMVDNYPLRGSNYKKEKKWVTSINETHRRVKSAVDAMKDKAVWYMPPMYGPSYWTHEAGDELTLAEMKLPVYAGLIAGAKGLIFFHWGLLDKDFIKDKDGKRKTIAVSKDIFNTRLSIMKSLASELKKLSPILCDGRPNKDLDIRWFSPGKYGPGPQLTRIMEYDGKQYLFVMNLLNEPIEAKVFGPDPAHNFRAYDAKVFVGKDALSTRAERPGEPIIKIAPLGTGVFVLTRRSLIKNTKFNPNKKFTAVLNNSWPEEAKDISYKASDDSEQHAMAYLPKTTKKVPLLVALHSWNGDYKQKLGAFYANLCVANNWAYVHPNFRGPNKRRDALCSELAIKDIIDAVDYAKKNANIDESRIYLTGFSGGGMAALMAMAKYPKLWAAVSVWCPVTDLNSWYNYSKGKSWQRGIMKDLEKVFGGAPDKDDKTKAEYAKRSPVTYFAKGISGLPKLDLNIGLRDRDIPVDQGIKVFNALAKGKGTITESELAELKAKKIPASLAYKKKLDYRSHKGKAKKLLVRKEAENVRLSIFNGHHEFCPVDGFKWLSEQKKN